MPSLVELRYNPYKPLLKIKINGKTPNQFSRLVQFADEDIWEWCDEILEQIYADIKDDFYLKFTGTNQYTEIMKYKSANSIHCIGYKADTFAIDDSLQKRMGKLNQLIKKNGISSYRKTFINAYFILSTSCSQFAKEIKSIDINNLFCSVKIDITDAGISENHQKDCMYIVDDDLHNAQKKLEEYGGKQKVFVIILGMDNCIIDITEKAFVYEATNECLLNTIFNCFIFKSLLLAFRDCISSLQENKKELKEIMRIEPEVNISVGLNVEVGKSNKIKVDLIPNIGAIPDLIFKVRNGSIASCDGMNLYGIREGQTHLEVYKEGEEKPFDIKNVSVIKRNRISKLILSDYELIMGIGDKRKIECDYIPEDADNVNEMTWKSTDESVISVDNRGNIVANQKGACKVMCIAENVSATCFCMVKPYLSDICIKTELDNGELLMHQLEELELDYELIPEGSFDDQIVIKSSDINVVNVINRRLQAKKRGSAHVTIENSNGRICKEFVVQVKKNKRSIFGKILKK